MVAYCCFNGTECCQTAVVVESGFFFFLQEKESVKQQLQLAQNELASR